ncbi:MAG: hypothetical protein ACFE9C_14905 [Candidatus Hodarchaeota archaeon]
MSLHRRNSARQGRETGCFMGHLIYVIRITLLHDGVSLKMRACDVGGILWVMMMLLSFISAHVA